MYKACIIFILCGTFSLANAQFVPPRQGSIENTRGEECEFITNITVQPYFTSEPQRIFIHTFQNYHYMLNSDKSKTVIAETIAEWMNRSAGSGSTVFHTAHSRWLNAEEFSGELKTGYAIPAKDGELYLFIDFEYSENRQYITRFMYTLSED